MGLTDLLVRAAAHRPSVLVAAMPGATAERLSIERELRLRGWPVAPAPAQADLLVVAGPVPPGLAEPLEQIWSAVPAPRARLAVHRADEAGATLDRGRRQLADLHAQRADLAARWAAEQQQAAEQQRAAPRRGGHGGHEGGHGGHGGHDMGGMQMPAGLPMAERGPDRDGLMLDQLHVSLGPLLPDWPAGLVLRVILQGDVIQQIDVETFPGGGGSWWTEPWRRALAEERVSSGHATRRRVASHLDSLGRLLAVAGWTDAAVSARRLRDDLLAGAAADRLRRPIHRFAARVSRCASLRWLTRGLGELRAADAAAAGVGGPALRACGDVWARYRQWLTEVVADVDRLDEAAPLDPGLEEGPRGRLGGDPSPSAALLDVLPGLLTGVELGAARLIVASLDPDIDELARQRVRAGHD